MKTLRKLFGETTVSWKLLIVLSIVIGAVVGLLNCVPFLEDTSFTYPAVGYEFWFVAALFIIVNCRKTSEAMLKTFVFFLISQPLIYLVEVPFKELGWEMLRYYPNWIIPTILTIPLALLAYQTKRDNIPGSVILSIACGWLFFTGIDTAVALRTNFPKGIVAVVFCIGFGIFFIQRILTKKRNRIVAYIISIVIAAACMLYSYGVTGARTAGTVLEENHTWEIVEVDGDVDAVVSGSTLSVTSRHEGVYYVTVRNESGDLMTYMATFEADNMSIVPEGD